jgi:Outer membrane lipoprotein
MGDPHRLLSKLSEGSDLERELLASLERADPPAHAKAEAWARVSAQIAAVAAVSTVASSAAAVSAATEGTKAAAGVAAKAGLAPAIFQILGAKTVLALAVAGVAVSATAVWLHVHQSAHTPTKAHSPLAAAPIVPAEAPEPTAAPSGETASPEPAASPVADPVAVVTDTAAKPSLEQRKKDQLSAESALLTQARAELRKGDASGAEQLLNRLQARFPKGVLGQEREVLAIEVLAARGNTAAAKRRAQAFISSFPESPHSAQLSRFEQAP